MSARKPRSMKVMGQRFDIVYTHHLTADASSIDSMNGDEGEVSLLGHCLSDDNTIAVRVEQGADRMRETILHEALHGLANKTRLSHVELGDGKLEEKVVGALAPALLLWLRENVAVIRYLQEKA